MSGRGAPRGRGGNFGGGRGGGAPRGTQVNDRYPSCYTGEISSFILSELSRSRRLPAVIRPTSSSPGDGLISPRLRGGNDLRIYQPKDPLFQCAHISREQGEPVIASSLLIPQVLTPLQTAIGKVDEILGPINQVYFTIKPQEGIVATSFKSGDKFYIGGDKLLPLEKCVLWETGQGPLLMIVRFLPKPKPPPGISIQLRLTRGLLVDHIQDLQSPSAQAGVQEVV
ncbi:MAG: hypothetical protein Q9173_001791 [Seirophora scorigena]